MGGEPWSGKDDGDLRRLVQDPVLYRSIARILSAACRRSTSGYPTSRSTRHRSLRRTRTRAILFYNGV